MPLLLIACGDGASTDVSAAGESGIDLQHVDGEELRSAIRAMDKDVVVLNVWATWCAPCIEEFPDFVRYSGQAPDNVAVRFVSVDSEGDEDRALAFLQRQGVQGVSYFREGDDQTFLRSLDPQMSPAIPITIIFDREGEIRDSWSGTTTFDQLRVRVRRVVQSLEQT